MTKSIATEIAQSLYHAGKKNIANSVAPTTNVVCISIKHREILVFSSKSMSNGRGPEDGFCEAKLGIGTEGDEVFCVHCDSTEREQARNADALSPHEHLPALLHLQPAVAGC